jgi:hypothetical protein
LTLYFASLSKVFHRSQSFLVESSVSFKCRMILSVNRDNLTSSFSICITFISFSYLIALAKNSSTMFYKSKRVDTIVSFLTLEKMVSCLYPFQTILAKGLSYTAFIMLRYVFPIPCFFKAFIIKAC